MIWKLGKLHQGPKLYKVNINDDPGLTLTYFRTMSNLVAYMFDIDPFYINAKFGKTFFVLIVGPDIW